MDHVSLLQEGAHVVPLRSVQEDYPERETRETRGKTGFLRAEEGVSHQTRTEMYLTFPKELPGENPQK